MNIMGREISHVYVFGGSSISVSDKSYPINDLPKRHMTTLLMLMQAEPHNADGDRVIKNFGCLIFGGPDDTCPDMHVANDGTTANIWRTVNG